MVVKDEVESVALSVTEASEVAESIRLPTQMLISMGVVPMRTRTVKKHF
jgi:hypothetical protein